MTQITLQLPLCKYAMSTPHSMNQVVLPLTRKQTDAQVFTDHDY